MKGLVNYFIILLLSILIGFMSYNGLQLEDKCNKNDKISNIEKYIIRTFFGIAVGLCLFIYMNLFISKVWIIALSFLIITLSSISLNSYLNLTDDCKNETQNKNIKIIYGFLGLGLGLFIFSIIDLSAKLVPGIHNQARILLLSICVLSTIISSTVLNMQIKCASNNDDLQKNTFFEKLSSIITTIVSSILLLIIIVSFVYIP